MARRPFVHRVVLYIPPEDIAQIPQVGEANYYKYTRLAILLS